MQNLTSQEVVKINRITQDTRKVGLGTKIFDIIALLNSVAGTVDGSPVNAVNAGKVLTLTGVVIDGEKVTINNPAVAGTDVYEFLADTAQTKTAPTNIAVDITANTTKATGTLTVDTKPTSGDTMTIGTKVYTFVPVGTATADGEISVGADLAAAKVNIVAAINGTDSINIAHTLVHAAAFVADACAITALVGGVAGNSIATTETFTAVTNIFAAALLGTGADCSAANAITALVAAFTAHDTQGVGAADGAGDTVELTADVAGTIGNAITIAETLANATFAGAATALSGGVNGTVGAKGDRMQDGTYLYYCTATNTTADKNWRRISLGVAY